MTDLILLPPQALTPQQEYDSFIQECIADWAKRMASGEIITTEAIGIVVDPSLNNQLLRDWVRKFLPNLSRADFEKALHAVKVKNELHCLPNDAAELVKAYVAREKITCRYDGTLHRAATPFLLDEKTGQKDYFTPDLLEGNSVTATYCAFMFPKEMDMADLSLELRILNQKLRLNFKAENIQDAMEYWYEAAKRERRFELFSSVESLSPSKRDEIDKVWLDLAVKVFDTSDTPPEFIVAVLKKFIHQVKAKLRGEKVKDHLMVVILGPQGIGKTTFVEQMTKPLEELKLDVDFKMIEDPRNIDIWRSYILFLDEMGYASKSDIDDIKKAITAKTLTRRPLYTNTKVQVAQNATFIGCSNKELEQLIKDPTGIRRFIGLRFLNNPCWDTMNSIDWADLWRSVDITAEDPIKPFAHLLKEKQEATRDPGRIKMWLRAFDPDDDETYVQRSNRKTRKIAALDLYDSFRAYEERAYPGSVKTTKTEWDYEMGRIAKNHPENMPFEKTRIESGVAYRYRGPSAV